MEKIFKREEYLKKIRGFYDDASMIKVITGVRRCGKSFLLKSIIQELKDKGIKDKDIINIELDKREYKDINKADKLDKLIESKITDDNFKYLFVDEVENVDGFETVINAYREEGNISIFITGSNSYLLSGELVTKLTGRYIEIELFTLSFIEYIEMKKYFEKDINSNIYLEFDDYIRNGGFPGSLMYDNYNDKLLYTKNIINQIFEKDIKKNQKIKDVELFEKIERFVVNNFGNIISVKSIMDYLQSDKKINVDRRTVKKYIDILENAKIIYGVDLFDIKSKKTLKGEKKYYLADLSIYFALNTDNRINYGPVLENVLFTYFKSKNYELSVGRIGKLECDFIVRENIFNYYYVQVTYSTVDKKTEEREYKPFYNIKDMYPRYLFTMDMLTNNVDGINNENIVNFIVDNKNL